MTPLEIFLLILNIVLFSYIASKWWRERKYAEVLGEGWEEEVMIGVVERTFDGAPIIYPHSWRKAKIKPVLVEIIPIEEENYS
jgi:hypothetical protein